MHVEQNPGRQADGRIRPGMQEEAVQGLRFAREVVVVERQKANLLELGERAPAALQARGEEPDHREQQHRVERQRRQGDDLDLRPVLDQPFLVEETVDREAERHPQAARHDGSALAHARGEEDLQSFDRDPEERAPAERAREAGCSSGGRDHAEKRAKRRRSQHFGQELHAAGQAVSARLVKKPGRHSQTGELLRKLGGRHQEVVGEEAEADVARRVEGNQRARAALPAAQNVLPQSYQPFARPVPERNAEAGADPLRDEVVQGDGARRKEKLREFDRDREERAQAPDENARRACAQACGEPAASEEAERDVEQDVGHPVCARVDAKLEIGRLDERGPGLAKGPVVKRERHQAPVDDEGRVSERDRAEAGGAHAIRASKKVRSMRPHLKSPSRRRSLDSVR